MTASVSGTLCIRAPLNAMAYAQESKRILQASNLDKKLRLECTLAPLLATARPAAAHCMTQSQEMGAWLTTFPNILNGTELSAVKFCNSLQLFLGFQPNHLPERCNGCQQRFTVGHVLLCRHGGLVLQRHDDLAGNWHLLCAEALTPPAVSDKPKIPQYQTSGANPATTHDDQPTTLQGNIAAHGSWTKGTTAIFYV